MHYLRNIRKFPYHQIYIYFTIALASVKRISLYLYHQLLGCWCNCQFCIPETLRASFTRKFMFCALAFGRELPTGSDFHRQGFQTVCIGCYKLWLMLNYFSETVQRVLGIVSSLSRKTDAHTINKDKRKFFPMRPIMRFKTTVYNFQLHCAPPSLNVLFIPQGFKTRHENSVRINILAIKVHPLEQMQSQISLFALLIRYSIYFNNRTERLRSSRS